MTNFKLPALLIIIAFATNLFHYSAQAQQNTSDLMIHLSSATILPESNLDEYLNSFSIEDEETVENRFFKIIQFESIPSYEVRNILAEAGVILLDYLPNNAYFAEFSVDFESDELANTDIRSIINIETNFKQSPIIIENNIPDHAIQNDGNVSLLVSYFANLSSDIVLNSLKSEGYEIIGKNEFGNYVNISVPVSNIESIAKLPYIVYIEPVNPDPVPDNYTARTLHRSNAIATYFDAGRHYDGSGVRVEIQDDGIIGPHIDYSGRILDQFMTWNGGDHGDHCAGTIMAAGNVDPRAKGMAYGADLYVYGAYPAYPGFNAIPQDYGQLEVRITSTSYSDGCNAGYTNLARTLDMQVREFPSLMHVFSAGNAGSSNCGYGAGAGWGNITGGHKAGKNVITVANLDEFDQLSSSSSRGPAHDGRIKPDISAKGTDVYSTTDPNSYTFKSGTSMSCPGVAGTLAQLFQAYRENHNGADPMAGLMKAIILNTAEDLGNPGPDFKYGWGRINALRAAKLIEESRFDSATIEQGEGNIHTFSVPENTAQVRVMVYWTDYQASTSSNWTLVNDIDILLNDPTGSTWNPWKLSHYPDPDSLNAPATRGIDDRNNMEQVTLDNPTAGNYTLDVNGTNIPQGPQIYYIVYEFIPEEVILTYPIGGESLEPGGSELIRWDAYGDNKPFTLEYSIDNGNTWDTIASDISGEERSYNWRVVSDVTGEALIRVSDGVTISQCEAVFSIIGVPCNLQVDWACDEAIHLSWSEVNGATSYQLYMLGEKYMDPVTTTTANSILYQDSNINDQSWFSVSALGENGAIGMRAIAVQNDEGTSNCNPVDAMMVTVPSVDWGNYQSWMDLSEIPVTVMVKNFGTEVITDPELNFQFDGGDIFTETYSGSIEPDSVLLHTFSETIGLSDIGNYVLKAWVVYATDLNPENDTVEIPINVTDGVVVPIGYTQSFDTWTLCWPVPLCDLYSCELEDGWKNLANNEYDDHDWRTFKGATPSVWTGPSSDHTTGTTDGQYLYIEPSVYCLNKEAILSAPGLDLTNGISPVASLWYHAYGGDIGWLHIDVFGDSEIVYDAVPPIVGNRGDEWRKLEIDLTPWVGQKIGLRLRGWTSCGEAGDFAIDDFSLTDITSDNQIIEMEESKLHVYPNPTDGSITIKAENTLKESYQLSVLDLFGRQVHVQQVLSINGNIHQNVNLNHLTSGVYVVRLTNGPESYQIKLTIR